MFQLKIKKIILGKVFFLQLPDIPIETIISVFISHLIIYPSSGNEST